MGRMYTVVFQGTVTNAGGDQDFLEIQPADDKPVRLRGFIMSQISELGDAAEEGVRVSIKRLGATFTSGSGGSAPTPAPLDPGDAAAGFTAEVNNTTVATTSGTTTTLVEMGWNIRQSPWDFWFPDERFCPVVKQGEGLVVRLESTVADDLTGEFTFFVEEI